VVIFTAQLSAAKDAPGEWKNYDHFLTKPFDPDGLLEAVRQAIGASGG
jgi:CheY-like chemotaxis protein